MKPILDLLDLLPGWLYALIVAGALAWGGAQTWRVHSLKSDIATIKQAQAEGESQRLREANRELSRLVDVTNNLNEVYRVQIQTIDRLSDELRARGLRVTKAERDAAIAAGTAEAVREYATVAADNFGACRAEYIGAGQEYAKCSGTAQSLKQWADEVTPSRPTPPTPPSQP